MDQTTISPTDAAGSVLDQLEKSVKYSQNSSVYLGHHIASMQRFRTMGIRTDLSPEPDLNNIGDYRDVLRLHNKFYAGFGESGKAEYLKQLKEQFNMNATLQKGWQECRAISAQYQQDIQEMLDGKPPVINAAQRGPVPAEIKEVKTGLIAALNDLRGDDGQKAFIAAALQIWARSNDDDGKMKKFSKVLKATAERLDFRKLGAEPGCDKIGGYYVDVPQSLHVVTKKISELYKKYSRSMDEDALEHLRRSVPEAVAESNLGRQFQRSINSLVGRAEIAGRNSPAY